MSMHPKLVRWAVLNPFYMLTGQRVQYYIQKFEKTQWLPEDEIRRIQWLRVKRMLSFVYSRVPFYRKLFDGAGITPEDITDEEDFLHLPLLTKDALMAASSGLDPKTRTRSFSRTTSGSSGTPLSLVKDSSALAVMDAIMHRNYGWYGIRMGDKEARFWGRPLSGHRKLKNSLVDFLLNRVRFSAFDISETACSKFVEKLRKFRPSYVYGYAQTVFRFSEQIVRSKIDLSDLRLNAVIVTGEMIFPQQVQMIREAFKTIVCNEYGCTEVGVIAMECPSGSMHLMCENLFVEFINNGHRAKPGEEGEIVITELYGNLIPLVRYKVGDIGELGGTSCACGRGLPILLRLKGRKDDFIICPDGKFVDPVVFEYILREIPSRFGRITEFRIIQSDLSSLSIEVVYKGSRSSEMLNIIKRKLNKVMGKSFGLSFNVTSNIMPEPSGKLRCFISRIGE